MTTPRLCPRCGDTLPDDAPPTVTTCRDYADWCARSKGDLLRQDEAERLLVYRALCGLDEALKEGWERLREDV